MRTLIKDKARKECAVCGAEFFDYKSTSRTLCDACRESRKKFWQKRANERYRKKTLQNHYGHH